VNLDKLKDELTVDEGRRKKLYLCTAGKQTIGIGYNIEDNGLPDHIIDALFEYSVNELVIKELDKHLPWWKQMTDARQRVLANMCFNLGIQRLLSFKNTLAYMKAGDYERAADGMKSSLWAKQVGDRATRLIAMMRKG
jgi:lysozyme